MKKYSVGVLLKCKDEIELIKVMEELTDHGYEFNRIGKNKKLLSCWKEMKS